MGTPGHQSCILRRERPSLPELAERRLLERHDLIWIGREYGSELVNACRNPITCSLLVDWIEAGRPFVVTRQTSADHALLEARATDANPGARQEDFAVELDRPTLAVGFQLPKTEPRGAFRIAEPVVRRFGFRIPQAWIVRSAPPLTLAELCQIDAAKWTRGASVAGSPARFTKLAHAARALNVGLSVYGSFAWQALTGLRYVTPESDIDLLLQPNSRAELDAGVALLSAWQKENALTVDGEILFSDGASAKLAVPFAEWRAVRGREHAPLAPGRVLVKGLYGCRLESVDELCRRLDPELPKEESFALP